MTIIYATKLGVISKLMSVSTHKVDDFELKIYKIATTTFFNHDKLGSIRFFEEIFLLANTNIKVVLKCLFSSLVMLTENLK